MVVYDWYEDEEAGEEKVQDALTDGVVWLEGWVSCGQPPAPGLFGVVSVLFLLLPVEMANERPRKLCRLFCRVVVVVFGPSVVVFAVFVKVGITPAAFDAELSCRCPFAHGFGLDGGVFLRVSLTMSGIPPGDGGMTGGQFWKCILLLLPLLLCGGVVCGRQRGEGEKRMGMDGMECCETGMGQHMFCPLSSAGQSLAHSVAHALYPQN